MAHCLLVLCGLPGSGKTSLALRLKASPELNTQFHIVVLSYDELMPESIETFLTDKSKLAEEGNPNWKKYREDIVQCMDNILDALPNNVPEIPHNVDADLWHKLQNVITFSQTQQIGTEGSSKLIIIDDNMYYRGMRYDFYQLARKHGTGYCQVYLKCDIGVALVRNQQRSSRIPDEVIEIMATKIEAPCPEERSWEIHSLCTKADMTCPFEDIIALVYKAQMSRVAPLQDSSELQESSRKQCSASALYQADQILRKLVTERMTTVASSDAVNRKEIAGIMRKIRTKILSELKSGELLLPGHIEDVTDASKDTDSNLYVWLKGVFISHGDE